jgi:hypothetical protein
MLNPGTHIFPKNLTSNSRRHIASSDAFLTDARQPIHAFCARGITTNNHAERIRRHPTKLFARFDQAPGNCAPFILLSKKRLDIRSK